MQVQDIVLIVLFFLLILIALIAYAVYALRIAKDEATLSEESKELIQNIHAEFKCLFSVSWPSKSQKLQTYIPFVFLLSLVISMIMIGLAFRTSQTQVFLAGLLLFFIGFNGFVVQRMLKYYYEQSIANRRRKRERERSMAEGSVIEIEMQGRTQPAVATEISAASYSPFHFHAPLEIHERPSYPKALPEPPAIHPSAPSFDSLESLLPTRPITRRPTIKEKLYITYIKPQFSAYDKNWTNRIKVIVRWIEFFQLVSFPIRDLLRHPFFLYSSDTWLYESIEGLTQVVLGGIPEFESYLLSIIQFLTIFWVSIAFITISILFSAIAHTAPRLPEFLRKTASLLGEFRWIIHLGPLLEVIYIPVLQSYISILKCFVDAYNTSSGRGNSRELKRCDLVFAEGETFIILALVGYCLSYLLMTLYLAARGNKPVHGMISYSSKSVTFLKNG